MSDMEKDRERDEKEGEEQPMSREREEIGGEPDRETEEERALHESEQSGR
jgi:hypothetical protein